MGLALGMALIFYAIIIKELKFKKFLELIPTLVVTVEKLIGFLFGTPIQNKVNGDQIIRKTYKINYKR